MRNSIKFTPQNTSTTGSVATSQAEVFRVALYIRVSTERQVNEGDSLEEQENELKKYCDFRKFAINNIYVERGKSGGNTNRPEYQKLIKDIKQKKINAVVVKKLDRLSRSLLDFETLMNLMNENEVEFISIKENFDTTTAMGKAMLRVALVFAQLEREQTSERIIDVMGYRASQGLYNGGIRPLGYTTINKEIVPYKKEKEMVEIMFDKFLETKSTIQTAKYLNDIGFRNRNNSLHDSRNIQLILQNPVYEGKIRWNGVTYQGLHQPIISEKKFQQVQDIFAQTKRIKEGSKSNALLQKLLFCGHCNSPMTPSYALNHAKIKYYYYRCTSTRATGKGTSSCELKYVPFAKVEQTVLANILALSQETQFKMLENKILKYNQLIEKDIQNTEKLIVQFESKLDSLKDKKEKYLDSLISSQYLSKERELINNKISELELEGKQLKSAIANNQFQRNQKEEEKINITQFKQQLLAFRTDHEALSPIQLRIRLFGLLTKVSYTHDQLTLHFKTLPWEEVFNLMT